MDLNPFIILPHLVLVLLLDSESDRRWLYQYRFLRLVVKFFRLVVALWEAQLSTLFLLQEMKYKLIDHHVFRQ